METINEDRRYARDLELSPFPEISEGYLRDNVTVHFHFAPHATPENLEGAQELFADADVLIPESYGWPEKVRKSMVAIAKGDTKAFEKTLASQHTTYEWKKSLFEMIRGSWRPLLFVESEYEQARQEGLSIRHGRGDSRDLLAGDSVETTLDNFADTMAESARRASNRDRLMVANLGPRLSELVAGHPKLRGKEGVMALSLLGTQHIQVYEHLASQRATEDAVVGSEWSGTGWPNINDAVMAAYRDGCSPTRQQMVRLMISDAVRSLKAGEEKIYDGNRMYGRFIDPRILVGRIIVEVMMEDQPDSTQLALDILRSRPGSKRYDEDHFRAYVCAAGERLDELAESINTPGSTPTP